MQTNSCAEFLVLLFHGTYYVYSSLNLRVAGNTSNLLWWTSSPLVGSDEDQGSLVVNVVEVAVGWEGSEG